MPREEEHLAHKDYEKRLEKLVRLTYMESRR
jgi:hypothetical protein